MGFTRVELPFHQGEEPGFVRSVIPRDLIDPFRRTRYRGSVLVRFWQFLPGR